MKKFIILFCIVILSGVLLFLLSPDEADLGDHYFYMSPFDAMDMGFPYGAIIYKSTEKNTMSEDEIRIRREVIEAKSNKNFVIAIQKQNESKFLNYFIIVKKIDRVYGPFNAEDYVQKQKELGVPSDLAEKLDRDKH